MRLKFGIEFVPEIPIPKIVKLTIQAEQAGFHYVWITDHYNNRNVYITLASIAEKTKKIRIGTGVTNPYLVSPAWTASAILTLNEISGGRAILGIGPGDKATFDNLGVNFKKPLSLMREAIQAIRPLAAGDTVKLDGETLNFSMAKLNYQTFFHECGASVTKKHYKAVAKKGEEITCDSCNQLLTEKSIRLGVPVYMGAQGPKMLSLAGELADGVLINASHPKDFEFAITKITEGAKKAGRKIEDIDITAYASFAAHTNEEKAKEAASIVVAFIVAGSPPDVLERHKIPISDAEIIANALKKGDFGKAMSSITPVMFEAFTIVGNAEQCIKRIKALEKIGVTQVVIGSPIGPDKEEAINYISKNVLSAFQD